MKTNRSLILRITLGIIILLLAGVSALQMFQPKVVAATAPASVFSAERAMADLQVIAAEPHSAGSEAQAKVRSYIIQQVEALGLTAETETTDLVTNILVRLPGSDSTKTVLISGHYDSHPPAPGAGDDGISVAAMLEGMRVLKASPPLRNDVLFLFTDGEELDWVGAKAYINHHPEAKDETGMLLVFDARPGNAPLTLIETSPGDAWLVQHMTGLSLPLWAASWKNIQERDEFNTDYDVFQPAGFTGIVMENEGSGIRYHTTRDTVDAISPNLVQAYGKTMLALANRFGNIDLTTRTEGSDWAFFTLSLIGMVAYPYWLMITLTSLAILAFLVIVVIAWRRDPFSVKRLLLSLAGLLLGIVLITLIGQLAWGVIADNQPAQFAVDSGFEGSSTLHAVLMTIGATLMVGVLYFLNKRLGWIHVAAAATFLFLIAAFAINTITGTDNPFTTSWVAWSFIGGVVGMGVLILVKEPSWRVAGLSGAALLVLALALPRLWMSTYTREDAWLTVVVTCLWMVLFVPQVEGVFGRGLIDGGEQEGV